MMDMKKIIYGIVVVAFQGLGGDGKQILCTERN